MQELPRRGGDIALSSGGRVSILSCPKTGTVSVGMESFQRKPWSSPMGGIQISESTRRDSSFPLSNVSRAESLRSGHCRGPVIVSGHRTRKGNAVVDATRSTSDLALNDRGVKHHLPPAPPGVGAGPLDINGSHMSWPSVQKAGSALGSRDSPR